jgi:hypothetical protein
MTALLVYTPTCEGGLRQECRESVLAQDYSGPWEWVIDEDDPFPPPDLRNVLAKYQRARLLALANGYAALVTVEHDMILPADALTKLAATSADVVYGTYVLRHGSNVLNTWQYIGGRNLGESLTLHPRELAQYRQAGQGRVSGVGWGCTLIRRRVLERIEFHDGDGQNPAADLAFATDVQLLKFVAMARFDVACGHMEGDVILHPWEIGRMGMVEVEALQNVNVAAGGIVHLVVGQRYSLPAADAHDLARAGYVRIVEQGVSRETATAKRPTEKAVRK